MVCHRVLHILGRNSEDRSRFRFNHHLSVVFEAVYQAVKYTMNRQKMNTEKNQEGKRDSPQSSVVFDLNESHLWETKFDNQT